MNKKKKLFLKVSLLIFIILFIWRRTMPLFILSYEIFDKLISSFLYISFTCVIYGIRPLLRDVNKILKVLFDILLIIIISIAVIYSSAQIFTTFLQYAFLGQSSISSEQYNAQPLVIDPENSSCRLIDYMEHTAPGESHTILYRCEPTWIFRDKIEYNNNILRMLVDLNEYKNSNQNDSFPIEIMWVNKEITVFLIDSQQEETFDLNDYKE